MRRKLFKPHQTPYSSPPPISPEDMTLAKDVPVTLAVIGCGQRGNAYSAYALASPGRAKVVACAEPRPKTRAEFSARHAIDATLVFDSWQALRRASEETLRTVGKRLADAVLVTVQDHMHEKVVRAFAALGYNILCEKPMATTVGDCLRMEDAVARQNIIFGMGHVMRYSPYSQEITKIVRSGELGRLVNIVQVEPVGYFHFAHSYVRGNWGREAECAFALLTKCCHDIDILCHWMAPAKPVRVSSFGSLYHFRREQKPPAAGDATKCLSCPAEKDCAYSAKKIYYDAIKRGHTAWPVEVLTDGTPTVEGVKETLDNTSYGSCVYELPNDVCDNQVVNIMFDNDTTVSFTMVAFTEAICDRQLRMHFTHGEIIGDMTKFTVTDFRKTEKRTRSVHPKSEGGGHGGGDTGLARTFVEAVRTGDQRVLGTDIKEVTKSHVTVFAAEQSRLMGGQVVLVEEFEKKAREEALKSGKIEDVFSTEGKEEGIPRHGMAKVHVEVTV
ncbi:NAD(P)-binding protein [Schizophyllum commune H4-8]|nr:NAD(P)-binding protein [Schizophyllum commune H4-8]KAI5894011.1 NAD(P)-binding protein [Schizophyllum commune H4-8]